MRERVRAGLSVAALGGALLLGGCATRESVERAQDTADHAMSHAQAAEANVQHALDTAQAAAAAAQAAQNAAQAAATEAHEADLRIDAIAPRVRHLHRSHHGESK
jgi:hypothetical protein